MAKFLVVSEYGNQEVVEACGWWDLPSFSVSAVCVMKINEDINIEEK